MTAALFPLALNELLARLCAPPCNPDVCRAALSGGLTTIRPAAPVLNRLPVIITAWAGKSAPAGTFTGCVAKINFKRRSSLSAFR